MTKEYIFSLVIVILLTLIGISRFELNQVKTEYSEYKGTINDQLQAAINEKKRVEAEQNAKLAKAKLDYSNSRSDLDSILDRLRNGEIVSRDEALQVAGCSGDSVSGNSTYSIRTQIKLKTYSGTCDINFYSDALKDNLQCEKLIEFVQ
jgi:hypothetical protein